MLGVLVLGTGVAAPAWAAPADQAPTDDLPHCVVTAVEVSDRDAGPVPPAECFATFAEAIAAATGGRVRLAADARTVDQTTLDAAAPMFAPGSIEPSATIIGIEYEHKNFGGWSYVIQSTNWRGCAGYSYRISSLPSGRNNEISSARTYASCKSNHYSGTNLTGSRYLCGCSQMGAMNDQTSSIFFSSTGFVSSPGNVSSTGFRR